VVNPVRKSLVAVAALGVAVTLAGCGGGSGGSGATATTVAATTTTEAPSAIGTAVKAGDLSLTVNSVAPFTSPSELDRLPENGQYLAVKVTVENHGSKSEIISSILSFDLRDTEGERYTLAFLVGSPPLPDGDVAAGAKLAGTLVYDVPKGRSYELVFSYSLTGSVSVKLGEH